MPSNHTSSKRRRSQDASTAGEAGAASAKRQKSLYQPNPLAKKYGHHVRPQQNEEGMSVIKKKIRDTERILKKGKNLQATQQLELERRIKALKLKLANKEREEREEKLAHKYKYVKFVESKKCARKLKQIEKALSSDPNNKDLQSELLTQRVNLAYIQHFPPDMKYISLFPTTTGKETSEQIKEAKDTEERRQRIWQRMQKAVESGEAERRGWVLRQKDIFKTNDQAIENEGESEIRDEQQDGDDFFLEETVDKGKVATKEEVASGVEGNSEEATDDSSSEVSEQSLAEGEDDTDSS
ncbi:hypothetical protein BC832DRAFT_165435 [Gaertneriomyces semiglobifer]|nr:hypothetical protein BC832DRAFT_165435 [Gaertneriomyces semiglobifer]